MNFFGGMEYYSVDVVVRFWWWSESRNFFKR